MRNNIIFTSELAKKYPGIIHGFGSAIDNTANPAHKYEQIRQDLGVPHFQYHTVNQVHKATVMVVDGKMCTKNVQADAMVSKTPGLLLCIQTADCTPILLFDPKAKVVAAIHAGWPSAYYGIVPNTVNAMFRLGAAKEDIIACIGPTIQQKSYEVDDNFKHRFCTANPESARLFIDGKAGHHFFDLPGYCVLQLRNAGIINIENSQIDTYSNSQLYSYRRDTHQGLDSKGRQVSAIAIMEA